MSHVSHMNESCHTYLEEGHSIQDVMSLKLMSQVSHMDESCLTHEWVVSHIWMSHVSHMNESCLTYEWVMSHTPRRRAVDPRRHVTQINWSCLTYERIMSHVRMSHVSHMNESCLTYTERHTAHPNQCDFVLQYVAVCYSANVPGKRAHDSRPQPLLHTLWPPSFLFFPAFAFIRETWLTYMWEKTHSCVWHTHSIIA